jgi:hypothetical protein
VGVNDAHSPPPRGGDDACQRVRQSIIAVSFDNPAAQTYTARQDALRRAVRRVAMPAGLQLVMSQGPNPGRAYALDRASATLGRDPTNEITINEPQVSRLHARVFIRDGLLIIEDMGSTNGTYVNGVRLTGPQTLTPGDVIGLGEAVTLTYYSTGATSTATLGEAPESVADPRPSAPPAMIPVPEPPARAAPEPAPAPGLVGEPSPYVADSNWDEADEEEEDEAAAKRRKTMLIGCGCLALFLACLAVGLFLWFAPASFWEFLIGLGIPIPPNPF